MAEPTRHTEPIDATAALEAAVWGAMHAGIGRLAQWQSLEASARAFNVSLGDLVGVQLAEQNAAATRDLVTLTRAVVALDAGTGQLVRWRVGAGPIKTGVRKTSAGLSAWPAIAAKVIVYATSAAITYGAWYLLDLWGGAAKVTADAERLRAQNSSTCQQTAQALVQAGKPEQAAAVARACAAADAAAAAPPPGILDQIKNAAAGAAIVAGTAGVGALVVLAVLALSGRGKRDKSRDTKGAKRWQRPVTFHTPVAWRGWRA